MMVIMYDTTIDVEFCRPLYSLQITEGTKITGAVRRNHWQLGSGPDGQTPVTELVTELTILPKTIGWDRKTLSQYTMPLPLWGRGPTHSVPLFYSFRRLCIFPTPQPRKARENTYLIDS